MGFYAPSKKMPEVKVRRVISKALNETGKLETYQVVPCFVLPYMTGYAWELEPGLCLHLKDQVPCDGLVYVFGKDESYWYRLRNTAAGTVRMPILPQQWERAVSRERRSA